MFLLNDFSVFSIEYKMQHQIVVNTVEN